MFIGCFKFYPRMFRSNDVTLALSRESSCTLTSPANRQKLITLKLYDMQGFKPGCPRDVRIKVFFNWISNYLDVRWKYQFFWWFLTNGWNFTIVWGVFKWILQTDFNQKFVLYRFFFELKQNFTSTSNKILHLNI